MNALYYGDNLSVLRESIANESVDLIYLNPPFNSSASYNVLFKAPSGEGSQAQIEAFEDSWHWNEFAEQRLCAVIVEKQRGGICNGSVYKRQPEGTSW
jgi:site-specific DNA-methyltransferase (adenine-specific)